MNLREQVDKLMDYNQALQAWDLVKDTNDPLKDKVWLKVRHAFEPEEYDKYYREDLREYPLKEEYVYDCTRVEPRLDWVVREIINKDQSPMVDLGCADGFLCLTLARFTIECVGVNLYKPSVDLANKRAWDNNLPCKFINGNLFDHEGEYEAVVLMEVLEHLPDPKRGIEKAYSLCKPGGSVYLSTPRVDHLGIEAHLEKTDREGWDDGLPAGHLRLFTEEEFRVMLEGYNVKQFIVDQNRNMSVEIIKEV